VSLDPIDIKAIWQTPRVEMFGDYDRFTRKIAGLRGNAARKTQLNLQVELYLCLIEIEFQQQSLHNIP
jgi:hypothetical protein